MARPPIFNDYDDNGYRRSVTGCRSSRTEDEAIVYNLRHEFGGRLEDISDQELVNQYDMFAQSDMFGAHDERFMEWMFNDPTV